MAIPTFEKNAIEENQGLIIKTTPTKIAIAAPEIVLEL